MADADERDDGGGFHEIEMSARAAQQRPRAVTKRRCRAERDERVHVGTADFELPAMRRDKIARRQKFARFRPARMTSIETTASFQGQKIHSPIINAAVMTTPRSKLICQPD